MKNTSTPAPGESAAPSCSAGCSFHRDAADPICVICDEIARSVQSAKLAELGEYLWPNQTGVPNDLRNPTIAVRKREEILGDQLAGARDALAYIRDKAESRSVTRVHLKDIAVTGLNKSGGPLRIEEVQRPAWMCQQPHGLPCLVNRGVINGALSACEVCAPHVEKIRAVKGRQNSVISEPSSDNTPNQGQ